MMPRVFYFISGLLMGAAIYKAFTEGKIVIGVIFLVLAILLAAALGLRAYLEGQ